MRLHTFWLNSFLCVILCFNNRVALQESELVELRETIETLKTQNTDAQTAIQVALNGPDHLHKGNEGTTTMAALMIHKSMRFLFWA